MALPFNFISCVIYLRSILGFVFFLLVSSCCRLHRLYIPLSNRYNNPLFYHMTYFRSFRGISSALATCQAVPAVLLLIHAAFLIFCCLYCLCRRISAYRCIRLRFFRIRKVPALFLPFCLLVLLG